MELSGNVNNLSDAGAIAYLHEQEKIRKARTVRRWIWAAGIIIGLFVLMIGCGIAVGAAASGGSTSAASAATTAPATSGLREETRIVPEPAQSYTAPALPEGPALAPITPAPSTELPYTWISEGMWQVGPEVEPGTYRSSGTNDGYRCMITVEQGSNVLDYVSVETGPARVTVATGQTVTVEGCSTLAKVG